MIRNPALTAALTVSLALGAASGAHAVDPLDPPATRKLTSPASLPMEPWDAVTKQRLRHWQVGSEGFRLTGEIDHRDFVVYLTEAEAKAGGSVQLGLSSAVSVMPEASHIAVSVNGKELPRVKLETTGQTRITVAALPADALVPGVNVVRVAARHRHRVDCSVTSTYELWTEIDAERSGVLLNAGSPDYRSLVDLAALPLDPRGLARVRAVLPPGAGTSDVARAMRTAATLAVSAGYLAPIVEIGRSRGTGPGIDILLGRPAELKAMNAPADPQPGTLALVEDTQSDRVALVIAGRDGNELDAAANLISGPLGKGAELSGHPAAIAATHRRSGTPVQPGTLMTLADLGFTSTEFDGRLYRAAFDLRFPTDFYPADTGKVAVRLAGGYAPGLSSESRIIVRVNGKVAAGLPLADPRGEVFSERSILVSLEAFRPGLNRIEIDAQVVAKADEACEPHVMMDGGKRFLMLDQTAIAIPDFARIARYPDLGASLAGGLARLGGNRLDVHVPRPDVASIGAASTVIARLAVEARQVPPFTLAFEPPRSAKAGGLVIGAYSDVPPSIIASAGLDFAELRQAWAPQASRPAVARAEPTSGPLDPVQRRVAALERLSNANGDIVTGSITIAPGTANGVAKVDPLYDRWREEVSGGSSLMGLVNDIKSSLAGLAGLSEVPLSKFQPQASTSLVFAQAPADEGWGAMTLITAPTPQMLIDGISDLALPERWRQIDGQVADYDQLADQVSTTAAIGVGFVPTYPYSVTNWRLVAASWFSHHPAQYAIALILFAVLFGVAMRQMLARIGQKAS